ncbi:hypothetical protein ACFLVJ_01625 [Chloroflexota bacterium]
MNNYARIGGILTIVSSSFAIFPVAGILFSIYMFRTVFSQPYAGVPPTPEEFLTIMIVFYGAFALFYVLTGTLGVVGGVFALKKNR